MKLTYKNVCVVKDNDGDVISVIEVKTLSTEMIKSLKEQAKLNISKVIKREELIAKLNDRLDKVEKELAYNRGEISEEEFKGGNE